MQSRNTTPLPCPSVQSLFSIYQSKLFLDSSRNVYLFIIVRLSSIISYFILQYAPIWTSYYTPPLTITEKTQPEHKYPFWGVRQMIDAWNHITDNFLRSNIYCLDESTMKWVKIHLSGLHVCFAQTTAIKE